MYLPDSSLFLAQPEPQKSWKDMEIIKFLPWLGLVAAVLALLVISITDSRRFIIL
jgi:hypothetical protein